MRKLVEIVQISDLALLLSTAHERFCVRLPNAGNLAKLCGIGSVDVDPFRFLPMRRQSIVSSQNGELLLHLFKFLRRHITDMRNAAKLIDAGEWTVL